LSSPFGSSEDDPKQRQPDITQAIERLGWKPRVNLADGLKPKIKYFRKILSGQDR